jgi:hypothetical protein
MLATTFADVLKSTETPTYLRLAFINCVLRISTEGNKEKEREKKERKKEKKEKNEDEQKKANEMVSAFHPFSPFLDTKLPWSPTIKDMYGHLATPLRKLYHELNLTKQLYATLSNLPETNKKQKQVSKDKKPRRKSFVHFISFSSFL